MSHNPLRILFFALVHHTMLRYEGNTWDYSDVEFTNNAAAIGITEYHINPIEAKKLQAVLTARLEFKLALKQMVPAVGQLELGLAV